MLNEVTVLNIREYLAATENGRFGEEELKELLSEFSCSKNADVERFLKEQATGALFPQAGVVRPFVHKLPVHGPDILRPQSFDMDQSPLSAAEPEMLDPGKLEILVLVIRHL